MRRGKNKGRKNKEVQKKGKEGEEGGNRSGKS